MQGLLIVRRPKTSLGSGDQLRAYSVLVDGKRVGSLKQDEVVTVELATGEHEVQARIDWTGSKKLTINIEADFETRLEVVPAGNAVTWWRGFFSRTRWLDLHPVVSLE